MAALPTKTIEQLSNGLITGFVRLGLHGGQTGTIGQQVHDGDTINVQAVGNFGVRFLGVDTPEVSFQLPGHGHAFLSIGGNEWQNFLDDPFAAAIPAFNPGLPVALKQHLVTATGPGCAKNHADHALVAKTKLQAEVAADLAALGQTKDTFVFFLTFAHEIMDRYGRFLCYVNRNQPDANVPGPRPETYNDRLVKLGVACPYFIWPNLDPFLSAGSIENAVVAPGGAKALGSAGKLGTARQAVADARTAKIGVFDAANPLRLQPFELRFLSRRQPPDRWVIDLSKTDDVLVPPVEYPSIPRIEHRLFVASEHVPLFVEHGWKRG